jgi:hypothetical protein
VEGGIMDILMAHGFGKTPAQMVKKVKSIDIDEFVESLSSLDIYEILDIDETKKTKVKAKLSMLTAFELKCYYQHFTGKHYDE